MRVSVEDIRRLHDPAKAADDAKLLATRFLIRPLGFHVAALFARFGLSANCATWLSFVFGVGGGILFAFGEIGNTFGALFLLIWLLLDHVDGSLARYYGSSSQYGDFLDTITCYFVLAVFPLGIGLGEYTKYGDTPPGGWVLFAGGVAAVGGLLPRLIYQKMRSYGVRCWNHEDEISSLGSFLGLKVILRAGTRVLNNLINPSGFLLFILAGAAVFGFLTTFLLVYALLLVLLLIVSTYQFAAAVKAMDQSLDT